MPICVRCNKEVGLLSSLTTFNKQYNRCGACERANQRGLANFRQAFLSFAQDGVITPQEWQGLTNGVTTEKIDMPEALEYVRADAINLLERTLTFAAADEVITDEEEQSIFHLRTALAIPDTQAKPILDRLAYLKNISQIRRGVLPFVKSSIRLESDEQCHLETEATYHKVGAKATTLVKGSLIASSKKLHFLSPTGGAEITYKTIKRIDMQPFGVNITVSKKTGNGFYSVADPVLTSAVIDTLVRLANRELLMPQSETASRHIPQDIKSAVWQRDQGKCVQCSVASYLEFDHIIPFSKGGASTSGNVQLLCRKCNLQKSDRI